jgi:hypothetical protein
MAPQTILRPNKSVNTDAQGRPHLRCSNSLGAGYVQRCTAWRRMRRASKAVSSAALSLPADAIACVSLRASGFRFAGGCAFSLGRVGAHAPMRVRSVQCHGTERQCGLLVRLHSLGVGAQAGLVLSEAMPPFSLQHSLRKSRLGMPAWLALATTAAYNRSVNTDAQGRPRLRRSEFLGRRLLSR